MKFQMHAAKNVISISEVYQHKLEIVNTSRTLVFPAPPPRLPDINVYVTDSGTSQGCLTLKKIITFIYVEKDNAPSLQALSRSPEQTLDLANNV